MTFSRRQVRYRRSRQLRNFRSWFHMRTPRKHRDWWLL